MRLYHYTRISNWKRIADEGILPMHNLVRWCRGKDLPSAVFEKYSFYFLTPAPWPCTSGALVLEHATLAGEREEDLCLLEISALPTDPAQVLDYSLRIPKEKGFEEKTKAYWDSREDLFTYSWTHSMPEVILSRPVPPQRIRVLGNVRVPEVQSLVERFTPRPS